MVSRLEKQRTAVEWVGSEGVGPQGPDKKAIAACDLGFLGHAGAGATTASACMSCLAGSYSSVDGDHDLFVRVPVCAFASYCDPLLNLSISNLDFPSR